jgi:hypothetical protein
LVQSPHQRNRCAAYITAIGGCEAFWPGFPGVPWHFTRGGRAAILPAWLY